MRVIWLVFKPVLKAACCQTCRTVLAGEGSNTAQFLIVAAMTGRDRQVSVQARERFVSIRSARQFNQEQHNKRVIDYATEQIKSHRT